MLFCECRPVDNVPKLAVDCRACFTGLVFHSNCIPPHVTTQLVCNSQDSADCHPVICFNRAISSQLQLKQHMLVIYELSLQVTHVGDTSIAAMLMPAFLNID